MAQQTPNKTIVLVVLIALGFAGLIGAHELSVNAPDDGFGAILPLLLAAAGTICFIAAGLMARKLMKQPR